MKDRCPFVRILLLLILTSDLWGCVSIEEVRLDREAFYRKTRSRIEQVAVLPQHLPKSPLWAGAARVEISPPPGLPLAGYGKRGSRGSEGTHGPLFARALALRQEDRTVILIAHDLLAITDEMKEAVLRHIQEKTPLSSSNLMLSATHTHSGPGALAPGFLEQFAAGPFNPLFFKEVTQAIASAALRAHANMQPARMAYGVALAPDLIHNRMARSGPIDPEIPFAQFQGLDGGRIASLVNFSAHATILKPDNFYYSGDYPGFFEAALEEAGGVALFTAGAVADQTAHPRPGPDPFERAEAMGRELARRVMEASLHIDFEEHPLLTSTLVPFYLPPAQVKVGPKQRLPLFLSKPFFNSKTTLQMIQIGKILLIGIPGDLSAELGAQMKQYAQQRGFQAIIIGFANDYIGYLLPRHLYKTPSYEASMAFHGPQMGEYLLEMVQRLIDQVAMNIPPHQGQSG